MCCFDAIDNTTARALWKRSCAASKESSTRNLSPQCKGRPMASDPHQLTRQRLSSFWAGGHSEEAINYCR